MPFSDLFDLAAAIAALRRALERDQLAGTYLLVGPDGVGKTALARALAESAACLSPRQAPFDACGACESCRRARAGTQPEIVLIPPAADQTQIWQFWDRDGKPPGVLQHTLPFAPVVGRKRVYIVERADTLTEQAANSLLKALEEPPAYALFVLLAPHPARMLPTILSRSQIVRVAPGSVDDLATWLVSEQGADPARARRYAAYAGGRAGAALRLLRSAAAEDELARVLDFVETIPRARPLRAVKIAETMRKLAAGLKALADQGEPAAEPANEESGEGSAKERVGRRQLGLLLDLIAVFYRDLLAVSLEGLGAGIVNADRQESLASLAGTAPAARWMTDLAALLDARRQVDQNVSIPLLTDCLASRLVTGPA